MNSKDWIVKAERFLPGGVLHSVRPPPLKSKVKIISHGKGAYIYTHDGRRFLDCILGSASLILGHCNPSVTRAVEEQISRGTNFSTLSEAAIRLAEAVVKAVPCAEKAYFVNSGSEATMYALRLARAYTGREKILKFDGAYHGFHDYLLFNTNYGDPSNWSEYPQPTPDSAGIPETLKSMVLVAPYNDASTTRKIVREYRSELAAIIVEPVMRGLSTNRDFLEETRELANGEETLLIFDETITGFRLALGGAQEFYGVTPDLATYGKALGGGYPIGAVVGREEIMELLNPYTEDPRWIIGIGSSSGNPLSATASLATLKELNRPGVYERLNGYGEELRRRLRELFEEYGLSVQMTGEGSIVDFYFTEGKVENYRDTLKTNLKLKAKFGLEMNNHGIHCGPGRYVSSTCHGKRELELMLDAARSSLDNLT